MPFESRILGVPEFDEPMARHLPGGWVGLLLAESGAGMQLFAKQFAHLGMGNGPAIYYTTEERPEDVRRTFADFGWPTDGLSITNLTERYQTEVLDRELEIARARERGIRYADIAGVVGAAIPPPVPKPTARILSDLATHDAPFRMTLDSLDFLLEVLPAGEVVSVARQVRRRCLALGGQALISLHVDVHDRRLLGLLEDLSDLILELRTTESKGKFHPVLTVRKVRNHPDQTRRIRLEETNEGLVVEA